MQIELVYPTNQGELTYSTPMFGHDAPTVGYSYRGISEILSVETKRKLHELLGGKTNPASIRYLDSEGEADCSIGVCFRKGIKFTEDRIDEMELFHLRELDWSLTSWKREIDRIAGEHLLEDRLRRQMDLRKDVAAGDVQLKVELKWEQSTRAYYAAITVSSEEARKLGEALILGADGLLPIEGRAIG